MLQCERKVCVHVVTSNMKLLRKISNIGVGAFRKSTKTLEDLQMISIQMEKSRHLREISLPEVE